MSNWWPKPILVPSTMRRISPTRSNCDCNQPLAIGLYQRRTSIAEFARNRLKPPHRTFVLCIADHFSSNLTQVHSLTMINSYQQPYKILNLGNSLFWTQFTNSLNPSTIGLVDRHSNLRAKCFSQDNFTRFSMSINSSFVNCQVTNFFYTLRVGEKRFD